MKTPTPWTLCDDGGNYICLTISGENYPICKIYQGIWGDTYPALRHVGEGSLDQRWEPYIEMIEYGVIPKETAIENAKFIVKACNSHEALVEALEAILGDLASPRPGSPLYDAVEMAHAALKLAGATP